MRIGIDLGGTKIEGVVLRGESSVLVRQRVATPSGDYPGTLEALKVLIGAMEQQVDRRLLPTGIGHPGSISPTTGQLRNANSTCLNGRPLAQDLAIALGREVRMANDADCLALSEAFDGAAAGAGSCFAVILGTGVGGGVVLNGELLRGANGIAGEWGHNPLPWPRLDWHELPGPACWCGQAGCIETWLSGQALAADHARITGTHLTGLQIGDLAESGHPAAQASLLRYQHRLARALAQVINLLDPDVIVLGGGVSRISSLYRAVPALWAQWIFSDAVKTRLVPAQHGDSSGVLGAARLWPLRSGN